MLDPPETTVVQLTPRGRGAIASLRVSGPRAVEVVARCFQRAAGVKSSDWPLRQILFGRWRSPAEASQDCGEELIVCRVAESRIEVHCHGGEAAVATVIDSLVGLGCRPLVWPEDREPRWQRDVELALAAASTERTALILVDQHQGALPRAVIDVCQMLSRGQLGPARDQLNEILRWQSLGEHLTAPWQVVLAGPPNAGKSSLINALVGFERAIVFDQPGTTRDVIQIESAVDGWPVRLSDTAGLREADDALEALGVKRARQQLRTASLVLLVFDSHRQSAGVVRKLVARYPDAILIFNKCDLAQPGCVLDRDFVRTSALTGEGIPDLMARIAQRLVPNVPPAGTPIPFHRDQIRWLTRARQCLEQGRLDEAERELSGVARLTASTRKCPIRRSFWRIGLYLLLWFSDL